MRAGRAVGKQYKSSHIQLIQLFIVQLLLCAWTIATDDLSVVWSSGGCKSLAGRSLLGPVTDEGISLPL